MIQVRNKRTGMILSTKVKIAKTFIEKTFGLLRENEKSALLFYTRFGIHTFFMKYPITVIVLDKNDKIRAIKQNIAPNRLFLWNIKYNKILELPQTQIDLAISDQLIFES